ncbi:MAG: hypothetical protein ABIA63_02415, partial [bacterium]
MVKHINKYVRISLLLTIWAAESWTQLVGVPVRTEIGVGSRATAMGKNYTAISNDASALFWNPAGMAFNKAREIQVSFGGIKAYNQSTFKYNNTDNSTYYKNQRFKIENAGYLRALETTQGGFSFGLGYQCPYIFDVVLDYGGEYMDGPDRINMQNRYSAQGQLDFWTGGFGVQIVQGLGMGVSLSLVTGWENNNLFFKKMTNNTIQDRENHHYYDKITRTYKGYDIRLGFMYKPISGRSAFGLRLVLPSTISFNEEFSEEQPFSDNTIYKEELAGYLKSDYSGAFGISYSFPFMIISTEIKARAPHPSTDMFSEQQYWKMGAG